MIYRIYTENINRHRVEFLVGSFFDGYTVFEGTGVWKGTGERSLVIEILATNDMTPKESDHKVEKLAEQIKALNSQESVLVTSQPVDYVFV